MAEPVQLSLNAGHDLVRRKAVVTVNRFVVLIIRVGIVTPGWIPPAVIPAPPTEIEKDDGGAMISPPVATVVVIQMIEVVQSRLRNAGHIAVPIAKARRRLG